MYMQKKTTLAIRYLVTLILILSGLVSAIPCFANASFAVAPDRVFLDLKTPTTQTFYIRNTGTKRIHLHITPIFYSLTSRALRGGQPLHPNKEKKTSLVPYTIVSPEALSLHPGEQREIRVSIHPPANLSPGTYREHILVKMLEFSKQFGLNKKNKQGQRIGIQLNMLMEMAVAVYGNLGHNMPNLIVQCSKQNNELMLHVSNPTPWLFSGPATILYQNNKRLKKEVVIYPDSIRNLIFKWNPRKRKHLTIKWQMPTKHNSQVTHCDVT